MPVCLYCLSKVKLDDSIQIKQSEYFHKDCLNIMGKCKEIDSSSSLINDFSEQDYGVDIAGNIVKIDKNYLKKYEQIKSKKG